MTAPTPVLTLLGRRTLETSLVCLGSLIRYAADPIRLVVHEDGSLTDADRERVAALGPGTELRSRAEADARIIPRLAGHPRCRDLRAATPLALKLFDIALWDGPGPLVYCDSDVLFLRPVRGLFRPPAPGLTFMADVDHALAVRPWQLPPVGGVRFAGRVNTGLIAGEGFDFDLDFLERLLGTLADDGGYRRRMQWAEQTCWAALAARTRCYLWDDRRVILADRTMSRYTPDVVAIHFVTTYRDRLAAYQDRGRPADDPPVTVGATPTRGVSCLAMLWSDVARRYRGN